MACLLEASVALDSSEYRRDENSVGCKMHNFTEHGHCSYRLYLEFKDRLRLVWGSSKEEKYQCFIEIGARMWSLAQVWSVSFLCRQLKMTQSGSFQAVLFVDLGTQLRDFGWTCSIAFHAILSEFDYLRSMGPLVMIINYPINTA